MRLPFPRTYWVETRRMLAGCYPGDKDQHVADDKLTGLINAGITCVINLMETDEVSHGGQTFAAYEPRLYEVAQQLGRDVDCRRFAIADLSVPSVSRMVEILDFMDERLASGETVYVHCWGGRGRTGTVVACHLRRTRGLSAAASLSLLGDLSAHNPDFGQTPEMHCQREFVSGWKEGA